MSKILYLTLSVFILMGCFSSCSKAEAPNCSDSNVKALVIDICTGELKNQLLTQAIVTQLHTAPRVHGNPTYEQWNQVKDKDQSVKQVIDYVDKQMAEAGITLTGIRTNGKNNEIRKCQCGGDLTFSNGKSHSIEYTAQYTEDGQIYVEVSGL